MDNVYVGSGKESKYGVKINLCIDSILEYAEDNIAFAKNGKKYINIDVNKMKQPDKFGNSHSVKVDTWVKPDEAAEKGIRE